MSDNPEPFVRQQRRIQEAALKIADDTSQPAATRIAELQRAAGYIATLADQLRHDLRFTTEEKSNG